MKAQVVFAGVSFAGVLSSSPGALAQQVWRDPYQLPQVPMRPAIQLPMPDQRTPLQTPGAPFALRSIAYPPPQPHLGSTCYADNAIGFLVQALPIASDCVFIAYGVQYSGYVGR
jgi:hypothetical protein